MAKRYLSALLALIMFYSVCTLASPASALTLNDKTHYASEAINAISMTDYVLNGLKSAYKNVSINSYAELLALSELVNDGIDTRGLTFYLTQSIDLNADLSSESPNEWTPIGTCDGSAFFSFAGVFDGCGYGINSLYFSNKSASSAGLFGCAEGDTNSLAVIKNVTVSGFFEGFDCVGGIVGRAEAFVCIINCESFSEIISDGCYAGGVAGYAGRQVAFFACANNSSVISQSYYVGGIAGYAAFSSVRIENCVNSGAVSALDGVGGIVGCSYGTVQNCANTAAVSGREDCGGIAGFCGGYVKNCVNSGSVAGKSAGGVAGCVEYLNSSCPGLVENCCTTSQVIGEDYAGAVIGFISLQYSPASVGGCYYTKIPGAVNDGLYALGGCGSRENNTYYEISGDSDNTSAGLYAMRAFASSDGSIDAVTVGSAPRDTALDALNAYVAAQNSTDYAAWNRDTQTGYPKLNGFFSPAVMSINESGNAEISGGQTEAPNIFRWYKLTAFTLSDNFAAVIEGSFLDYETGAFTLSYGSDSLTLTLPEGIYLIVATVGNNPNFGVTFYNKPTNTYVTWYRYFDISGETESFLYDTAKGYNQIRFYNRYDEAYTAHGTLTLYRAEKLNEGSRVRGASEGDLIICSASWANGATAISPILSCPASAASKPFDATLLWLMLAPVLLCALVVAAVLYKRRRR